MLRRVIFLPHLSGLPHLPGVPHLHVNRPLDAFSKGLIVKTVHYEVLTNICIL